MIQLVSCAKKAGPQTDGGHDDNLEISHLAPHIIHTCIQYIQYILLFTNIHNVVDEEEQQQQLLIAAVSIFNFVPVLVYIS